MGSMKDLMIEMQEAKNDEKLAKILGITYDELLQLDHEIDTDESSDGLIYNYIVEFGDDAPKEILDKINGLEDRKRVWIAPWEFENSEYYDDQYEATLDNKNSLTSFREEIENLKRLNDIELADKNLEGILKRQIFIGAFGTLETFLSDTFINLTTNNDTYFRNFIETYPEFRQRKFELREIFLEHDKLKDTGKKVMLDIIYHDLPKVKEMYRATFKINFPELKIIIKSVQTRHDLVHRNGKTKDGDPVTIDKASAFGLIDKINIFVETIASELKITA